MACEASRRDGAYPEGILLKLKQQGRLRRGSASAGVLLWLLSGCGGGGGGADAGASPPPGPPVAAYSVGGTATGISGPGLVLQLNGAADMAIDVSRDFAFTQTLSAGSTYAVTVRSNPVGQVCALQNASGTVNANVTSVTVVCTTPEPPSPDAFRLGGTISGLAGSGLILRNGMQDLPIAAGTTSFVFPGTLASGAGYQVGIAAQPTTPAQTCTVSNGMGMVGSSDVTNVSVSCVTPPASSTGGLTLDTNSMAFEGEEGQSVAPQSLSGAIAGATEPVIVTVTVTDNGLLGASFSLTSSTSGQLRVTPRQPGNLAPGIYRDNITVSACYDSACARPVPGSPKAVEVTYTVKTNNPAPVLHLSDHGVAFASVPGSAQLSRRVVVRDSSGATFGWKAASSATWLSASSAGASGGVLQLTANPAGLPDGFHQATVSVSSDNPAITGAELIRVGLYVSQAASAASLGMPLSNPIPAIAQTAHAVDPIRPLVYSTAGSTIAANHVHTGARAATLTVPGAELGGVAANDDGSRLYALNYANGTVVVVDLDTMGIVRSYGFPQLQMSGEALKSSRIHHARVHGRPVLLMTHARLPAGDATRDAVALFKADTGELVGELFGVPGWEFTRLAVSRDGTTAYAADAGLSGILSTARVALRANSLGNVYGRAVAATVGVNESTLQDIATNEDGSRVWVGYGTDRFVREAVYNGTSLDWTAGLAEFGLPSNVQTNGMALANIEVDAYGKLFVHDDVYDLRVYTPSGTLQQRWQNLADATLVAEGSGSMRMSSDGLRLIGNGRLMSIQP